MSNENVVEILSKLISCKSLTPEDDGCQKYIANYLEELGFKIEINKIFYRYKYACNATFHVRRAATI